jgi:competence protein ComEC
MVGEVMELGDGVRLEILHPGPELDVEDRNENSVAMRLVYEEFAVLLTGDAEEGAEQRMMASGRPLRAAVFKAGHHGSRSSSSRTFLQAVRPQIVVISVGKENKYEHPHAEVLQRAEEIGAAVLRTDELGSIEIVSDGRQIWFDTER